MPTTDPERRTGREGFTLVEVLVAMVILAIGLLALEAMGIGAARAVARADLQSEYTALATDRMERALSLIRQNQAVAGLDTVMDGATLTTSVVQAAAGTRQSFTVTVTVTPTSSATRRVTLTPVTVVGRAIR
ncbi:MAG TPA: prepilin-type N-terminal cleavage/methylation domain-containing protein [Longimicrobium sp.]|nr:prepilin-type N-terminal cleavage/methylation domain-containing protein [Longimicrobium sp.]